MQLGKKNSSRRKNQFLIQISQYYFMKNSTLVFYSQHAYYLHTEMDILWTHQYVAYSVVLSTASFLVWKFVDLLPPNLSQKIQREFTIPQYPNHFYNLHPYMKSWLQLLCEAVEGGKSMRIEETCHFRIKVSQQYAKTHLIPVGFQEKKVLPQYLQWQLRKQRPIVLFLSCSQSYIKKVILEAIQLKALYYGIYYNNENWKSYKILLGERPSQQDYMSANLIIVPGSSFSMNTPNENIEKLCNQIQYGLEKNSRLKFLGVCFGMQLLAKLYGGTVKKMAASQIGVTKIWPIKNQEQNILNNKNLNLFTSLFKFAKLNLQQVHHDQVTDIPPKFINLLSSKKCQKQLIVSQDGRCLGIQGHPQYTRGIAKSIYLLSLANSSQNYHKRHKLDQQIVQQPSYLRQLISKFIQSTY